MWAVTSALCVAAVLSLLFGIYDLHNAVVVGTKTGIDAAALSPLGIKPDAVPQSVVNFAGALWALGEIAASCLLGILARIAQAKKHQGEFLAAMLPTTDRLLHPVDTTTSKGGVIRNVPTAEVAQYKEKGWKVVARASTGACMRKFSD